MTVKLFLLTALFGLSVATQAQNTSNSNDRLGRHNVYLNGMFAGQVVSINYEFRLQPNQRGLGVYAGIGLTPVHTLGYFEGDEHDGMYGPDWWEQWGDITNFESVRKAIPFGINYLFGADRTNRRFELGLGFTYVDYDMLIFDDLVTPHTWLMNASVGFRHYYADNRFMWRLSFIPVVSLTAGTVPVPWFEGGVGLRF